MRGYLPHRWPLPACLPRSCGPEQPAESSAIASSPLLRHGRYRSCRIGTLHYNINWPSGLSLGEGDLIASVRRRGLVIFVQSGRCSSGIHSFEAAKSTATATGLLNRVDKDVHARQAEGEEKTTFDSAKIDCHAQNESGRQVGTYPPPCAKDALGFPFLLRHELASGRLPQRRRRSTMESPYQTSHGIHRNTDHLRVGAMNA